MGFGVLITMWGVTATLVGQLHNIHILLFYTHVHACRVFSEHRTHYICSETQPAISLVGSPLSSTT